MVVMRAIKIIRFGVSEDIKQAIRNIIDDLERYNYSFVTDPRAIRMFSRFVPDEYKGNIIVIGKSIHKKRRGNTINIEHGYKIKKNENYDFEILNR